MFKPLLVTVLFGLAAAYDVNKDAEVRNFKNVAADVEGNFAFGFQISNGIAVQVNGNAAGVSGAFQYISPDGTPIQLGYTADEDGFHPVGTHLPTPPPIPEEIIKSVEYIKAHPPKEDHDARKLFQR